jgi:L-alanine-DL-glutamate epimerase-like enolase superfamily enzyme
MRIVAVHERTVSLAASEWNANVAFDAMTGSAVAVVTDATRNGRPLVGLAFDTIGRYAHGGLLRERFIPRLVAADPSRYSDGRSIDPYHVWDVVMANEKAGGHGERSGAVGLIDAAIWDLVAKTADEPLWRHLAARNGEAPTTIKVPVYASGGHYRAENDIASLLDEIRRAKDVGNVRFKIKAAGASLAADLARVDAVLPLLEPGMTLALDANGAFDLATASAFLGALAHYPIAWIEEPTPALDYALQNQIAATSALPIATGENLFSYDDARNLRRYGGLRPQRDIVQIDILASYGVPEYERILADYADHGWARDRFAPHAGHLFAMHAVAGLGLGMAEIALNTASLFGRITAGVPLQAGEALLPETPGVGFESSPVFSQLFSGLFG